MKMRRLGLTGGIASGKSTVSALLREWGYPVIDADAIYHDLTDTPTSLTRKLGEVFGSDVLQADGALDRKALGAIVFSDEQKRRTLNTITHPAVFSAMQQEAADIEEKQAGVEGSQETKGLLFFDIPLLIETLDHSRALALDGIWLVTVSPEVQVERLMRREGIGEAEAKRRMAAQMPLSEKEPYATQLIRNDGDLQDLKAEVQKALLKEKE